jgi:cephalosporin hydroxylase
MLELVAACGGPADAVVLGVDIDIRSHNRVAIESHPLARRVSMIEGSSVDPDVVKQVVAAAHGRRRVMVCLDSNHTHEHVLAELEAYARLTSPESYCVVFDTIIERMPKGHYRDRPWDVGNNPMTAVRAFLVSVAPQGFLRRRA